MVPVVAFRLVLAAAVTLRLAHGSVVMSGVARQLRPYLRDTGVAAQPQRYGALIVIRIQPGRARAPAAILKV